MPGYTNIPGYMSRTRQAVAGLVFILATLSITQGTANAEHPSGHHETATATGLHLSTELGELLRQEMAAIQEGMKSLVPAIVSGNWKATAATAEHIRDSYILQQELTPDLMKELHRALPASFQEMDRSFHHYAGMLAHAAEMENSEIVAFYYYKLTDTCIACHSKFAARRFPGLAGAGEQEAHRH